MQGRRLPDTPIDELPDGFERCDYWRVLNRDGTLRMSTAPGNLTGGVWMVVAPLGETAYGIGRLELHTVREEDDGSISVRPDDGSSNSIKVTGVRGLTWHGFIERGEWLPS